jgi:RNA polymerase sigma-70 factor (ECF subfamily)
MARELANLSDQQLLERLASSDQAVLKHFFDTFYAALCRHGIKYVRIAEVSEEIVQEVFVNFWERRTELNIDGSVSSYLYSAVRYRCINYIRNQLPKEQAKTESVDLADEVVADFDTDMTSKDLIKRLRRAIADLPEKCRIIFLLAKEDGLTYREIAEELEVSEKTVENQMGIALKKLRMSLMSNPRSNSDSRLLSILFIFFSM